MFRFLKPRGLLTASATVTLAGVVLAAATAALAQPARADRLSDAAYIQAAACAGWAPVVGDDAVVARVEAEGRNRLPGVTSRARTARDNAARQARRAAGDALARQQLAARFEAECAAFAAN